MRFEIITDVDNLYLSHAAQKRDITHIVVHHSATLAGDAESFHRYHTVQRGWADIGYHFVVGNGSYTPPGFIQLGRDRDNDDDVMEEIGAHVLGFNRHTIGICMVGNFDEEKLPINNPQVKATVLLIIKLIDLLKVPIHRVIGHCEAGAIEGVPRVYKTCPGLNIDCNSARDFIYQNLIDEEQVNYLRRWYREHIKTIRSTTEGVDLNYLEGG